MATTAIEALRQIQQQLAAKRADVIPDGWRTAEQWAAEAGLAECTVRSILTKGVKAGLIERHQYAVDSGVGVRQVWHFRQK